MIFDRDLTSQNVQDLSNPDAVVAFFAGLGYNTDVRTQQTPANLGISADGTLRPIKQIELIADQDRLLQVYLFELKTVTVTHTRALAQVFKNRTGSYLLVLTSDYERIDFVLIEKYVPQRKTPARNIGQPHIGVRPKMLTVDRRKPEAVHLRVLRRFTYTESDPIAQYDKLVAAFAIADWSEEYFNNRALFSDHYLKNRLPTDDHEWPEWREDPKPTYRTLNDLYRGVSSKVAGKPDEVLRKDLVEPCLNALGFHAKSGKKADDATQPDYILSSPKISDQPLALCLVYPWMRYLDGKDYERDNSRPDDNPGQKVVSLLEQGDIPWAIVTNGKIWRLYSQRTHAKATNYYEIDLDEILAQDAQHAGGPGEPFRYFWLIFRRQAFELESVTVRGESKQLSFLDRLLNESEEYAKELGERLKERVFEDVFPLISDGFIKYIQDRDGIHADLSQDALDDVFLGTLTLLYRLLFLLYAEARDLLPVKEVRGYYEASLTKIKKDISEIAGTIDDEVQEKIKKQLQADQYGLYDRLNRLFKVIDIGDDALNVPVYNGGLFITELHKDDKSQEAGNARFLAKNKVPDRFLAHAIDLLARGLDPKRHDLVPVDYKSLGVRQLGSIYEGLLEFKLRLAETKMAIVKGKKTEEVVPYSDATKNKLKILTIGRGKDAKERIYKKGEVYLENDKKERKATGSYYTPDHIVKYIVEHAVGPVLKEKFEAMRPKLRQAQLQRKAWFDRQKAMKVPNPESQADNIMHELADELFDIKVLDPAMGSGHFLVEAVDFITDKALTFLMAFPWNPVIARLEHTRQQILEEMDRQGINIDPRRLDDIHLLKRHVLKRCIHGVDLNPMAVELAKVSLWLDCFTLGAPLSFLDHHLKCGNSLIGVTVEEVDEQITRAGASLGLFSKPLQSIKASLKTMLDIGDLPDVTPQQVVQSRNLYNSALSKTQSLKRLLDVYTSRWFGNPPAKIKGKKKDDLRDVPLEFLNSEASVPYRDAMDEGSLKRATGKLSAEYRKMVETAERDAASKRFFHWEMEYPEVFYKVSGERIERVAGAGFDAIVGNPPYVRQEGLGEDKSFFESAHGAVYSGVADLYVYFYHQGLILCREHGRFGMITSNKFLRAGYGKNLRAFLSGYTIDDIVDFRDLPIFGDAISYPLIFIAANSKPKADHCIKALTVEDMALAQEFERVMETGCPIMPFNVLKEDGWVLQRPEVLDLLDKIRKAGRPLGEVIGGKFYYGIKTGFNEAFVIDEAKRQELIAQDPKSAEIIKPFLRGKDIKRYRIDDIELYLLFIPWHFPLHQRSDITGASVEAERAFKQQYPAVYQHMARYKDQLISRNQVETGIRYEWFALQRCAASYWHEFEKPKIVWPDISPSCNFAFDDGGHFLVNTAYILPTDDLSLLAILNSSLVQFYYAETSSQVRGNFLRFIAQYVETIPIASVPASVRRSLETHVRSLLDPKTDAAKANEHEREIDRIVNESYGLSEEEVSLLRLSE